MVKTGCKVITSYNLLCVFIVSNLVKTVKYSKCTNLYIVCRGSKNHNI